MVLEVGHDDLHVARKGKTRDPIELSLTGSFRPKGAHKVAVLAEDLNPSIPVVPNENKTFFLKKGKKREERCSA